MRTALLLGLAFLVGCSCSDDDNAGNSGGDGGSGGNGGDSGNNNGAIIGDGGQCGILATVRDFDVSHPDFEHDNPGLVPGLVMNTLDGERKPVYAHGNTRTGGIDSTTSFAQWYRDVDGINQTFSTTIPLTATGNGTFVYDNDHFFPVDNRGFGNSGQDQQGATRNFGFTTEIHTSFEYMGGEVFTFRGDDDLWLFVDGKLAIDLGGVHGAEEDSVRMDDLGLTVGQRYSMDIFHAERHTHASNFRVETTIACFGPPIPI